MTDNAEKANSSMPLHHISRGSIQQGQFGLPDALAKIFEEPVRPAAVKIAKNWTRQDLSKPKKETIDQYKQVVKFLPGFIRVLIEKLKLLEEKKYNKVIVKLNELLNFATEPSATAIHLLDLNSKIQTIKEKLVEILKSIELDNLKDLQINQGKIPTSFNNLYEVIEISRGLDEITAQTEQSDMLLSDLGRRALNIEEPALALKVADRISTDIIKMMLLKHVMRYYSGREEVDEALKIIMSIPNKPAKIQLIKALAYTMGQ